MVLDLDRVLDAYEALITAAKSRGEFSFGDSPTIADVYLVPQLESARRLNVDTTRWARLTEIYMACMALPAFQKAAPGMQPDACRTDEVRLATHRSLLDLRTTVDKVVMAREPLSAIGHEEGDHLGDFRRPARTT